MITVKGEAREILKKKDKEVFENLCELLSTIEVYYNGDDVPLAETTKALHQFIQKTLNIMYMKMRPYIYEVVTLKDNKTYFLDVLTEEIKLKGW